MILYTSTIISLIQTLVHCSASKSIILNFMKFNKYLEENADLGFKWAYMNELVKAAFVELKQ